MFNSKKSVVALEPQGKPLPQIYGYTPVFPSEEQATDLSSRFRKNTKLKVMVETVLSNPGIKSDELSAVSGVSNIHQYRRMANENLRHRGYEIKDFKDLGVARNADFYQWYLVESKSNTPSVEQLEAKDAANDSTVH
ncbi:hypothetical protein [Vibrio parahaemolyticus]|uniref:hypothetical protein n=2 Tax=Vibrio parahaemolyticus TaxID=670 RepID=UPI00063E713C|nr:hypothetical protein [Vibrio parahaemolyticus]KLI85004.1 hypothetical protein AAY62_10080 [Vibrio parahaemolyticus]QQC99617.1 hypothetical protein JCT86_04935 [Vibrio parahaemolyticus]TNZ93444.1 hypothetical protein CGK38_06810 [Vibrio parahaemolyticus]TOG37743.1 hypothetical protein CGJ03_01625 [Vibrio parahaemolyticus]